MGRKTVSDLLTGFAVVFTALLLVAAVLSWRASFVSPEAGNFWASIGLLVPVILLLNLTALVWWLLLRRWGVALMPVAVVVGIALHSLMDGKLRYSIVFTLVTVGIMFGALFMWLLG